jgi:uncharacterized DUF497 family protein
MAVTFDLAKNAKNIAERGLSFERVAELDWDTAVIGRIPAMITASRVCS